MVQKIHIFINGLSTNLQETMKSFVCFLFILLSLFQAAAQKRVVIPDSSVMFTDDRDNQSYRMVKIGNQTWMAENLNYQTSQGSWCYDNESRNCETYGRLYIWEEALHACPSGWHLPMDEEWKELEMYLGMSLMVADQQGVRGDAGGKLKETGMVHWKSPNNSATDEVGFTALPGGIRGKTGAFYELGDQACFWSATSEDFYRPEAHSSNFAWGRILFYNSEMINRHDRFNKNKALSIRCVKD